MRSNRIAWAMAALAPLAAAAGSLKDIKHIVLFMQENRAFDHVRPQASPVQQISSQD